MPINHCPINDKPVNDKCPEIWLAPAQPAIILEQEVFHQAESQSVIALEQTVILNESFEGEVITLEQEVVALAPSQPAITLEQTVSDDEIITSCNTGYCDLIVAINGIAIPNEDLLDEVIVERGENEASVAKIVLRGKQGLQEYCDLLGKAVTIDSVSEGNIKRIYTGIVNYPEHDVIEEKTIINCTDNRREQINSQLRNVVRSIGYWSDAVFGNPDSIADELDDRLTTVPLAVDFDPYGNYTISNILPKDIPDFILTSNQVYRRQPRVEVLQRARIVNKVEISLNYRYNRFHHANVPYQWRHTDYDNIGGFLLTGRSIPTRDMIKSAAEGAGWQVGNIVFDDLWNSGWYNFGGTSVGWSTTSYTGHTFKANTDSFGNKIIETVKVPKYTTDPVTGEQKLEIDPLTGEAVLVDENRVQQRLGSVTVQDMNQVLARAAYWSASNRWAQTLTENYIINVQAPESIQQFGEVVQQNNYGVQSEADDSIWERYEGYAATVEGYSGYVNTVPGGMSYYIDYSDNRSQFNSAFLVAVNKAKTTIIRSHRDNRALVQIKHYPEIDLRHTVELDTNRIKARGKVIRITHVFKANKDCWTEIELAASKVCYDFAVDSSFTIPSKPGFSQPYQLTHSALLNYYGIDPTKTNRKLIGYVGNQVVKEIGGSIFTDAGTVSSFNSTIGIVSNTYTTQYPTSFTVETPDIPDDMRNELSSTRSATYTVNIPNNLYDIYYPGEICS